MSDPDRDLTLAQHLSLLEQRLEHLERHAGLTVGQVPQGGSEARLAAVGWRMRQLERHMGIES